MGENLYQLSDLSFKTYSLLFFPAIVVFCLATSGVIILQKISNKSKFQIKEQIEDNYVTARGSQSWYTVALSLFTSSIGCWILIATPETGALTGILGVIGYALSNGLPFLIMCLIGPVVSTQLENRRAFSLIDYFVMRYDSGTATIASLFSLFFMFIFLSVELTSIGDVSSYIIQINQSVFGIITIALVTLFFTIYGGAPLYMITDRILGVIIFALLIIVITSVFVTAENVVKQIPMQEASASTSMGGRAFLILVIAVTSNQFLDQSMWQKLISAKTNKDARIGFFVASLLIMPCVFVFGYAGIYGKALAITKNIYPSEQNDMMSLFLILSHTTKIFFYIVFVLAVWLVCTTVDSLESGILALLRSQANSVKNPLLFAKIGTIIITCVATAIACQGLPIISLFLFSNLISCTFLPALLLAWIPSVTGRMIKLGTIMGFITIFIVYAVYYGSFFGVTALITSPMPYGKDNAIAFIVVPIVSFLTVFIYLGLSHITPSEEMKTKT